MALKSVDGDSIAAYNLFWQNSVNHQDTNIDATETILADPELDENDQLLAGSPAINAGTASFIRNAETVLELQPDEYSGIAPDLGAYERIEEPRQRYLPIILR
jgi:hypothetical protein